MEYQIDSRNRRTQEVRVGQGDQEIAAFRRASFFVHNLKGEVDGLEYQLKHAAPWNDHRYQLVVGSQVLATAARRRRMHAFEPDRPLIRHNLVEFELDVAGRILNLTPEDRHGSSYRLDEAGQERGRLILRSFEAQMGGAWQADLTAPDSWSVPLVAFVAWLAREGRSRMTR